MLARIVEQYPVAAKITAITAAAAVASLALKKLVDLRKAAVREAVGKARRAAQKPNVVYLFQFPRGGDILCISPFCATVEAFLRETKIPYELVMDQDMSVSPTGAFPFVEVNGEQICDSGVIMERLAVMFKRTTAPEKVLDRAVSLALRRTITRSIRLHFVRFIWVDNTDLAHRRIAQIIPLPDFLVRRITYGVIRKENIDLLNKEGHGDLSDAEYHAQFLADVVAVEAILDAKEVKLSSEAIATTYAWFCLLHAYGAKCPATNHVVGSAIISRFLRETEARLFPDIDAILPSRPTPAFLM